MRGVYFIHKERIPEYLDRLRKDSVCLIPEMDEAQTSSFTPLKRRPGHPNLLTGSTDIPFKEFVYPGIQTIFTFKKDNGHIKLTPSRQSPIKPTLVFGLRPCDTSALSLLTRFGEAEPVDRNLLERRETTKVITVACNISCPGGFCTSIGTGPVASEGFDIQLIPYKDGYIVESVDTEAVMEHIDLFEEAEIEVEKEKAEIRKRVCREQPGYNIEKICSNTIKGVYLEGLKKEFSRRCQKCGGCVFICPTCTCFDIVDVVDGDKGERLRVWDACFFDGFTVMAQDFNPLRGMDAHLDRRLKCKLCNQKREYRIMGCVGCGRCDRVCPGDIGMGRMLERASER